MKNKKRTILVSILLVLGANGVSIRTPELYESLQRKVIDGNLFPMSNMDEYKLEEQTLQEGLWETTEIFL